MCLLIYLNEKQPISVNMNSRKLLWYIECIKSDNHKRENELINMSMEISNRNCID